MSKLNGEQIIIKALKCCQDGHIKKKCSECPYLRWVAPVCRSILIEDAHSLIKELTKENEKLNTEIADREMSHINLYGEMRERIKQTKADTARKMQEKILTLSTYGTINISPWQLEQVVKEVLEGNK